MVIQESDFDHAIVKILLVEDDDVDVMAIERALKRQRIGNPMVRVKNGQEALDLLESGDFSRPYIILLDLNMPVMGGLEFLEKLRTNKNLSDSVVFVLTTSRADEDITASYKKNIAGYFLKTESGAGIMKVVDMLDGYWKLAHLPK